MKMINKITTFLLAGAALLFATKPSEVKAQVPTTQDCKGAIAVCDYIYHEDSTASGYGNYYEIPTGQTCATGHCMDGEKNSRWYVFTVVQSGQLRFQITPVMQTDDYDWAVFNITTYSCDDIKLHPNWMMRSCNAAGGAGYQGATGVSTANGGNSNCSDGGNTNKWNTDLTVFEGETYVLVVSDWTQTPGGYTLDFSASSAVIFDDQAPFIDYIGSDQITTCGTNELLIRFNEKVKCASVDAGDFSLTGSGGPYVIDSIYGETCSLGGDPNEKEFTLYVSPPFTQGGSFELKINPFSYISDACDNYALPDSYPFTVDLESPTAFAGDDQTINYGTTTVLYGSASGGSGNNSYHWEPDTLLVDPNIQQPTTMNLTANAEFYVTVTDNNSGCTGEDTVMVTIEGGELINNASASSDAICNGDQVELFSNAGGGSGSYIYLWTSDPAGFNSTLPNPVDFPSQTTTFFLDVFDGFTHSTGQLTITVHDLPVANAGDDQIINPGTPTLLHGEGAGGDGSYAYHWEPASYLVDNDIQNPDTKPLYNPTIFSLWVTDGFGCVSNQDDVFVNPAGDALAIFAVASPQKICYGDTVAITASATGGGEEYNYQWSSIPAGFTSNQPSFTVSPDQTTTYHIVLTDQYGNEVNTDIQVTVYPLPVINLIPDGITPVDDHTITVCVRDSVLVDAGQPDSPAGTSYFWIGEGLTTRYNKVITNGNLFDVQKHTVRVTHPHENNLMCSSTDSLTIVFSFKECGTGTDEHFMDISNVFSIVPNPNTGDFSIEFSKTIKDAKITVYTMEGVTVYTQSGLEHFSKGDKKQMNLHLPKGVYFVHLQSGPNSAVQKVVVN